MENNIVKIQRYYRIYKLSNLFNQFEKYNIGKNNSLNFNEFTKCIQDKKLLDLVKDIILSINKLCNTNVNISPRIILTAFLIKHFTDEIIGNIKDRNPIDIYLIDWSKTLVKIFKNEESIYKYKLLINYLDNYLKVFNDWKKIDKNRSIQNIIIAYNNRMNHYLQVSDEDMNIEQKEQIKTVLISECDNLINSLKIIDPTFDIEYLKSNHNELVENIQKSMNKIYSEISHNFKKAYLNIIIDEFKNDNYKIILNLINETNDRILLLSPKEFRESIQSKLRS